jgi:hypothetical protein
LLLLEDEPSTGHVQPFIVEETHIIIFLRLEVLDWFRLLQLRAVLDLVHQPNVAQDLRHRILGLQLRVRNLGRSSLGVAFHHEMVMLLRLILLGGARKAGTLWFVAGSHEIKLQRRFGYPQSRMIHCFG